MTLRSGTCAMCARWEGGEESERRGGLWGAPRDVPEKGGKKPYSTQCSQVVFHLSTNLA